MSDARQRLLDALAEVEGLEVQRKSVTSMAFDRMTASLRLYEALHSLLPTLSALKEVVEDHDPDAAGICKACHPIYSGRMRVGTKYPCSIIRTLARQFEEE